MNIVPIEPCICIPDMLRNLADELECSNLPARMTIVLPNGDVRTYGGTSADISQQVVFDCQQAIHRIMCAAYGVQTRLEDNG